MLINWLLFVGNERGRGYVNAEMDSGVFEAALRNLRY